MKTINSETRWAGRTYRHAATEGGEGGGGGGSGGGEGEGGAAGGEGEGGAGGEGEGGEGGEGGSGEDWRGRYLGYVPEGDERTAAEKLVGRFTSEQDFITGAVQAHTKLRAGEISSGLPENPTDEQLADYRAAHGIPDAPDKYDLGKVEANRELSDVDREILAPVMEKAHGLNISNDALNELIDTYMGETDKLVERMGTQDNLDMSEFTKVAKENWGADYGVNMNRITNQMNMLPEAVRSAFKQARLPDGRAIMASPEIMHWIVGMDRQITPLDPMKGGEESTMNDARKIVGAAKVRMRDDREAWFKDTHAQKEFQQAQDMIDRFEGSQ